MARPDTTVCIGLISDTHGLLRPQAAQALQGCAHIVHAGDIGSAEILQALTRIAPVTAVRGNNDIQSWGDALPLSARLHVGDTVLHVLHDLGQLADLPARPPCQVVVSGHTHRPLSQWRDGVLYVNPGSAGPRRFSLPVTLARLTCGAAAPSVQIVALL
jgi:putative phosphoesterase